ncbi:TonB-dependent receptor domain-containing protein, partial [Campylobacter sp. MOP51]|uniref:TonB-dependent receptor domain-containing protein n=1 Tax=Campylobacter canis TaxID=3378588 RepID=UPI003C5D657D
LRMIAGVQSKSTKLDYPAKVNNVVNFHAKEKETYIAPYTQVEYRPVDQILAIAGVRYDRYTYDQSSKKSSTSPRFSLSYF